MSRSLLALALATLAAGCALLSTPRDPARFYALSADPGGTAADMPPAAASDLTIGLGPITLPGYLERGAIATRESATRIVYSDVDWWAEPLDVGIARALRESLVAATGASRVQRYPWLGTGVPRYQIAVDVIRFERDAAGAGELAARWVVQDVATRRDLVARDSRFTRAAPSPDTAGAVAALSATVADLGREIGAAMRELPRAAVGGASHMR